MLKKEKSQAMIDARMPLKAKAHDVDEPVLKQKRRSSKKFRRSSSRRSMRDLMSESSNRSLMSSQSTKRSVRFALDDYDQIQEHVYPVPSERSIDSKEEKGECWWSGRDLTRCRFEVVLIAEDFMNNNTEYKEAIQQLLKVCCAQDAATATYKQLSPENRRNLAMIAAGKARGLELQISMMLQHRRLKGVAAVVETQDKMKRQGATQRAHMIALQYRRGSEYSTRWSRLMAHADEVIASSNTAKAAAKKR